MTRISDDQVHAAYNESVLVYRNQREFNDAIEILSTRHLMNKGSARDFLDNFKHLMAGKVYNRTLNGYATKYFLERIEKDFGSTALRNALQAVNAHIEYYESLNHGKLRNIRKIHDEFKRRMEPALSFNEHNDNFDFQIGRSLRDSSEMRKGRLKLAPKIPLTSSLSVTVFKRNPDVVAEVLLRASGQCERCNCPAPFRRKKDGTPYLEIHHKIQLASGGEDSVENAMAVCPNCHRKLHYG